MKSNQRMARWVCQVVTVFAACSVSAAQRPQKSVEETLKEQLDLMVKECKLNDEQQKTLNEKFKAKQDALEAWDKTNAEKMKNAQDAAATARKGTDADAKKKANGDLRALQTEREQSAADADKAILAALTDDQKSMWAGAQLTEATLAKYKKSNLTDDQTAKIKSACQVAAKELGAFTGDDRKDKQGRAEVQKCLKWAIDNVILATELPKPAAPATPAPESKTPSETK
ncbi:MAG TPA: hypothetical protein VKX17_28170 [Planctomycetota bacterium]|nr:hypothetical protein [Planctomycetota bacterium]